MPALFTFFTQFSNNFTQNCHIIILWRTRLFAFLKLYWHSYELMALNGIGILPNAVQSYVDHLVPLCQIMGIPLLVTDPWMKAFVEVYYPPMDILLVDAKDYILDPFLKEYDPLFYVDFFRKASGCFQFQDYFSKRKVRSVMGLHGNPDKYWDTYWLERLNDEDIILAYGPQLLELLVQKGVKKRPIISGNYRLEFYKAHAPFFDATLPFRKEKTTLLYAPTWSAYGILTEHREYFSPFFTFYRELFDALSDRFQLIVKLHPHLAQSMPVMVKKVMHEYPHIYFLQDYPLIYPLLNQIDLYLGDYSSVGYDFLHFDRPLFFVEPIRRTALHGCGQILRKEELSCLGWMEDTKGTERKMLYNEVFGEVKPLAQLKQEIEDACRSHPH
jgi:teichoic acid glycerol-phosphate primase